MYAPAPLARSGCRTSEQKTSEQKTAEQKTSAMRHAPQSRRHRLVRTPGVSGAALVNALMERRIRSSFSHYAKTVEAALARRWATRRAVVMGTFGINQITIAYWVQAGGVAVRLSGDQKAFSSIRPRAQETFHCSSFW